MEKLEQIELLKIKSLSGIASLLQRQILVKLIFFVGNLVLARILIPQVFGAYAIIVFAMQFFSSFGDVGLGAALIQLKREPTTQELSTTFWAQQILVGSLIVIVFIVAPHLNRLFPLLPFEVTWMARVLSVGFVFSSLRSLPVVLMERHLDFQRIARIEIFEQLIFFGSAISLALAGFQIWSFIIATLIKEAVGTILVNFTSTWRPSLLFQPVALNDLVRFGLPYQVNNILNFIKEGVTPLFVGAYCGVAGVGFVSWAKTLAFAPLLFSESFGRVAFPAYSAIQENRSLLIQAIEKSVRMMTFVLFPISFLMAACAPEITAIFFTEKWLPGLGAFYFFCTTPLMIGLMLPMYSAILSLGKSSILLKMSFLLVLLEWGLGIPLVIKFGYTGIAVNQPIITGIYFFLYRFVLKKEGIILTLGGKIWRQFFAALFSALVTKASIVLLPFGVVSLVISLLGGIAIYALTMKIFGKEIFAELREHISMIYKRA